MIATEVMWAITAVAVLVVCLGHPVHTATYLRKANLDNFVPTNGNLFKGWSMSILECSRTCESYTGTQSYFYVQNTHDCECHGTRYPATTGLSSVPSSKYYEKQGSGTPVATVFSCPTDELSFKQVVLSDGVQFKYRAFVDMAMSFEDAVTKCSDEGATLFEVLTVAKFNFSMELMACPGYLTKSFWLSGVYNITTAQWETLGGVPLPMSNTFWYPGSPDQNQGQPCLWMYHVFDHKWDDVWCSHAAYPAFTICEMP